MNTSTATYLQRIALRVAFAFGVLGTAAGPAAAQSWFHYFSGGSGQQVRGSGKVVSEQRALSGYDAVAVQGPHRVILRQSGHEGVEVSADDNIVPLIETQLENGTLVVRMKKGYSVSTRDEMIVTVDLKQLKKVSLSGSGDVLSQALRVPSLNVSISGSGDVALNGLITDELSVAIAGSGDFTASGQAAQQRYSVSGSGDVRCAKLQGAQVKVKIAGSGDAQVWATATLDASIAGSGDVRYTGDAKVSKSVAGSGSVTKL